jgi:hypothetical protein
MSMLSRILDALAWRSIRCNGVWSYQQNRRTGARRAIRMAGAGYQPVDAAWLRGGTVIG